MDHQLISFRCPNDLLKRINRLAFATRSSRTLVITEAVRIFTEEIRKRGGYIVPPFPQKSHRNKKRIK